MTEPAATRTCGEDLPILYDTIRDLTSTLSVNTVIERLLARVLAHLNSEIASILLVGPDQVLRITHAEGLPETVVQGSSVASGEGISGHVFQSGEALLIENIEIDPRFGRDNHERYYTNSAISVPLRSQGRVVGVLNVNNKHNRQAFTAGDLRLIEAIAGHASIALFNAQRYQETLERAQHDALTGLANHGHFWSSLEQEMLRARRYRRDLSLVMLDVDHFKQFNDTFGHRGGDQALCGVARLIAALSRASDFAARYGGEEFAIVLPETTLDGALAFADNLRMSVQMEAFTPAERGAVTLSAGVAAFPTDGETPPELVESADRRLYQAKDAGRNCVCADA